MAGSVNKVILIGNLGADPEIKSMRSGDRVASFRVACSESWKDKQTGDRKEKTEWVSVVVWNDHLIKIVEKYLRKGSKVYVEGSLQTRKWQDSNGQDRYMTEVVLQKFKGEITMLGEPKGGQNDDEWGSSGRRDNGDSGAGSGAYGGSSDDLDDEIPF